MLEDKRARQLYRTAALHELWARTKVCRFARKVCRLASKRQKMAHGTASGSAPQALPKGPHNTIPTSSCDLSSPKNVTLPQRFVAKHKGSWAECIEKVR